MSQQTNTRQSTRSETDQLVDLGGSRFFYGDTQPVREIRVGRQSIEGFTSTGLIVETVEADHCEYRKSEGVLERFQGGPYECCQGLF